MRVVTPLVISPSEDLALVAQRFAHRMPRLVRYVIEGLGTPDAQSADLMSYLLFDASYTRTLVEIGYRDASARIDELEAFLRAGRPARQAAPAA
jgi:NTE family protein